jgi:hypothetical protein
MAASDYVPIFFKNRLHLAGRPQMGSRPSLADVPRRAAQPKQKRRPELDGVLNRGAEVVENDSTSRL